MLTNYFAVSFPLIQHPDNDIYTMASTDSASIATDKITINGKQLWHLFISSMIFCSLHWKPVLILSLFYTFINTVASTIDFNSIISIAPGLKELFQSLEQITLADLLADGFYFLQPGELALLVTFLAVTFIFWLIFYCFIITLVVIAWYRFILASGDEKILRSVFRWGNKHTRFLLWQLIVVLAVFSLMIGVVGAFYIFYMEFGLLLSSSGATYIAFMLGILTLGFLLLWGLGVFLRACLIFPCLAISSDISIKQIFNKTPSNFNKFFQLIPLQLIIIILGIFILSLWLAQLIRDLLNINLNEIYSQYSYFSVFMTEFIVNIPAALWLFWLATFFMFIASHFFPAQFKSVPTNYASVIPSRDHFR